MLQTGAVWQMTSAIVVEDVSREVKLLKAFSGQKHMLKFYDAFEDSNNVYLIVELCEGGALLDRILQIKEVKDIQKKMPKQSLCKSYLLLHFAIFRVLCTVITLRIYFLLPRMKMLH